MDEEIVADSPPTREEAPTQGTDAPAAAAGAAATEEAGDASGDQGEEAPMEPTAAGAGGERTPSPLRSLEVGDEGGAPTSPLAAPEAAASPRQEASDSINSYSKIELPAFSGIAKFFNCKPLA